LHGHQLIPNNESFSGTAVMIQKHASILKDDDMTWR